MTVRIGNDNLSVKEQAESALIPENGPLVTRS